MTRTRQVESAVALLESLLSAIMRADGDALVMHVGERPYVVAASGPVELSSRTLTLDAVSGMLAQLLPYDSRRALDEFGAIEHELPPSDATAGQRFTVVAARGGDDIWIEVRRYRQPAAAEPPAAAVQAAAPPVAEPPGAVPPPYVEPPGAVPAEVPPPVAPAETRPVVEVPVAAPEPAPPQPAAIMPVLPPVLPAPVQLEVPVLETAGAGLTDELPIPQPVDLFEEAPPPLDVVVIQPPAPVAPPRPPAPVVPPGPPAEPAGQAPAAQVRVTGPAVRPPFARQPARVEAPPPAVTAPATVAPALSPRDAARPVAAPPSPPAARTTGAPQPELPPAPPRAAAWAERDRTTPSTLPSADRLLRVAKGRGAQALLLTTDTRPAMRLDGTVAFLDDETPLSARDLEAVILELAPGRLHESVRAGANVEWSGPFGDVGRVHGVAFRDHRGPGCVLSFAADEMPTVEQLGLAKEFQALATEGDGLVLVAAPRASGKSTLVAALVDLVNRTRGGYTVTLERQVRFAHESRAAVISQREVAHAEHQGAAAWSALREDPDVLVVDDLRSGEAVEAVIEAVSGGRLVIATVTAHGAADGLARILSFTPPELRAGRSLWLAGVFRAAVSQVLLRKAGGGRVAARELLLGSALVRDHLAAGRLDQLPVAQDDGRSSGMIPLTDPLLAFVQSGVVDAREAYKQAFDRPALLAAFRREGLDTSFVERLA